MEMEGHMETQKKQLSDCFWVCSFKNICGKHLESMKKKNISDF